MVGKILAQRGVKDVEAFFDLGWDKTVNPPTNLDFVEEAAKRIIKAMENDEKIAVLVDVDMDGFTSSALLINYLKEQAQPHGSWPDTKAIIHPVFHEKKVHGLGDRVAFDYILAIKPDLLIIPDASGTGEHYAECVANGIDVVVLDHHDVPERGDGNKVIVVNNQQSEKYTNKALSGVGVTWQTARMMDNLLPYVCADQYLDLVALGLVSDVMDVRSPETRFLIAEGLKPENMHAPICVEAPNIFKDFDHMTNHFVGWSIGPVFNAVSRIGSADERNLVFGCFLDENRDVLVKNQKRGATGNILYVREAWRQATNAQSRQNRRRDKLFGLIEELIQEEALADNKVIVLAIDDFVEEYRALSGLVAAKIADAYQRPAIITFLNKDGTYSGSLRAPDGVEAFENFREQCLETGCCKWAMGHGQAAGICLYGDAVIDFIDYFNDKYAEVNTEARYDVDFIFDEDDPDLQQLCFDLDEVGDIWGHGLDAPVVAVKDVHVKPSSLELVGKNPARRVLRIKLANGVTAIKFNSSMEEFQSLCLPYTEPPQYFKVNIVGTPELNRYAGYENPQINIIDYEVVGVGYEF